MIAHRTISYLLITISLLITCSINTALSSKSVSYTGNHTTITNFPAIYFSSARFSEKDFLLVADSIFVVYNEWNHGKMPFENCIIEWSEDVFGATTPTGLKLGKHSLPSRNNGHYFWEVLAHEYAHDLFGGTSPFYYKLAAPGPFLQESLAVFAAHYYFEKIRSNPEEYGIQTKLFNSLMNERKKGRSYQKSMYKNYLYYEKFDLNDILTSQALDYTMIELGDKYGWDKYKDFCYLFESGMKHYVQHEKPASAIVRSTYIVSVLSVLFEKDLRKEFQKLRFPIDDKLYDSYLKACRTYLQKRKQQ